MYAMLGTWPDICFAIQTVLRFNNSPGLPHWEAVKQIFTYLIRTKDLWLRYGGQKRELIGYADADGSMAEDRKAISGYAFIINGGAVSYDRWLSHSLPLKASMWLLPTQQRKLSGSVHSYLSSLAWLLTQPHCFPTINQPLHSPKNISIMHVRSTLIFIFISFVGSLKMESFA